MPFVGGPPTRITNPRWGTAAMFEKSKNRHISSAVRPIFTKFGTLLQFHHLDRSGGEEFKILKIQYGGDRHVATIGK